MKRWMASAARRSREIVRNAATAAASAAALRLRAATRLSRVGLHLAAGLGVVACVFPFLGHPARLWHKRRWSRQLLGMLGVRLMWSEPDCGEGVGKVADGGEMIVANHVSWLDIFVINAVAPAAFVAKDDVRSWPLIGWLSMRTDTLFIERGSARAAQLMRDAVRLALRDGQKLVVFPEGTTTDGSTLLPFRGALLQGALDAGAPLRPVALHYMDGNGERSTAPVYVGETGLLESLWCIAIAKSLQAHVRFLPALAARGGNRRALAGAARDSIAAVLKLPGGGI